MASEEYFTTSHDKLCRDTFDQVFDDVESKSADYGLVAIENSLYGSINDVYDLLLKHRIWISGEFYMQIYHCLLGPSINTPFNDIKTIRSHPVALAQCEDFLQQHFPHAQWIATNDTAGSAKAIAQAQDPSQAAIASRSAAELYGLPVLAKDIESHTQNYTRFITLQSDQAEDEEADKSSIILRTDHSPGALYKALGAFYKQDINLTKIESRPIFGQVWQYQFYIDFEAGLSQDATEKAFKELKDNGCTITMLGSYRSDSLQQTPHTKAPRRAFA